MGEIQDRLGPDEEGKLSDSAALGRSNTTMSVTELTEYAGAAYAAFNLLEARINALDSVGVGTLTARVSTEMASILSAAGPLGRSGRLMSKPDLSEFAGALYLSYEDLTARVATLEGGPAGTELEGRLETGDKAKLVEAGAAGRAPSLLSSKELSEWAGATDAAYTALEARVGALEAAT